MRFETSIHIDAPADSVWDLCADPIAVSRLCGEDLTIRPAEAADQGTGAAPEVGARYRSLIRIGAAIVGGDIMIVHYTRAREFAWNSITGIEHRVRLRLRPDGGGTQVTLRFSYDVPGLFGTAVDFAAYPRLRGMLRGALEELARQAEHGQDSAAPQRTFLGSAFAARIVDEAGNIAALRHSGLISPMRPDRLARMALAVNTWGLTLGAAVAAGAVRYGDRAAVDDEFGTVSYTDLDRATDAIAVGLVEAGVRDGDAIAVMTRNHRGFLQAVAAAAKAGCDVITLNTGFSGPQVAQVCRAERPTAVIADSEFDDAVADAASGRLLVRADPDSGDDLPADPAPDGLTLRGLAARHDGQRPPAPEHVGEVVILTSGTTGSPKGARRGARGSSDSPSLEAPAALLERIPLHAGDRVALPAPLFHTWGMANLLMALALGGTVVLKRRFDPEQWLATIESTQAQVLIVAPVMLQRMLALDAAVLDELQLEGLRVVATSGSELPGDLAGRWMDRFGENLYNLYGSTEVAYAAIASPRDLRAAPGTVGTPTRGTTVRLYDDDGLAVPQGGVGRIFVGNSQVFGGYTSGDDKDRINGLAATGDLGRFDTAGRLFVVGRDDEMIVSGGENVFPREVEDVLARHPAVADVACIGVDDPEFGARLRAFVVLREPDSATKDELRDTVRTALARYKTPRDVLFLPELPRNATGKILKRELAQMRE